MPMTLCMNHIPSHPRHYFILIFLQTNHFDPAGVKEIADSVTNRWQNLVTRCSYYQHHHEMCCEELLLVITIIIRKCMKVILTVTLVRAEERHKLVTASLNFYKTAEQVSTFSLLSSKFWSKSFITILSNDVGIIIIVTIFCLVLIKPALTRCALCWTVLSVSTNGKMIGFQGILSSMFSSLLPS